MTRISPGLAGLLGLGVLAACAPSAPVSTAPAPSGELARVHTDTAAPADSLAAWLRRGCRGSASDRAACVERALYGVLPHAGIARTMAVLDALAENDADLRREAHGLAHGLGLAAYRGPETVAETFAACPYTQIAGCYHGVIQGYFLDLSRRSGTVTAEAMNQLCEPHRARSVLYFQCTHGIGHGLMALLGHQVPPALEKCDLVTDPGARDSCYGGVFMENIVAETHPHATAEAHAAVAHAEAGGEHAGHAGMDHSAMDHGGMDHSGMDHGTMGHGGAQAGAWKPLDAADPLYPCSAVAAKYQYQCYLIQTSAILPATHGDIAETARICARAPQAMVNVCWASLGRDLTSYAARDPAGTAALCARAGEAAEPACIRGAAVSLVDVNSNPADGLALCRVAPAASKSGCYVGVGGAMLVTTPAAEGRAALCAGVEADYVADCRRGAALR